MSLFEKAWYRKNNTFYQIFWIKIQWNSSSKHFLNLIRILFFSFQNITIKHKIFQSTFIKEKIWTVIIQQSKSIKMILALENQFFVLYESWSSEMSHDPSLFVMGVALWKIREIYKSSGSLFLFGWYNSIFKPLYAVNLKSISNCYYGSI